MTIWGGCPPTLILKISMDVADSTYSSSDKGHTWRLATQFIKMIPNRHIAWCAPYPTHVVVLCAVWYGASTSGWALTCCRVCSTQWRFPQNFLEKSQCACSTCCVVLIATAIILTLPRFSTGLNYLGNCVWCHQLFMRLDPHWGIVYHVTGWTKLHINVG